MAEMHPILWTRLADRRLGHPHVRCAVLSTFTHRSMDLADIPIVFKPGTDLAILNYIANHIIQTGRVNEAFVRDHAVFMRGATDIGYGLRPDNPDAFVLPDQNGWSRNLHFEAAWLVLFTGFVYVIAGLRNRHFRNHLLPSGTGATWRPREEDREGRSYNTPQRLTYLLVIFGLLPVAVWTGLAMSPALVAVFPILVTLCGGLQSARTIHFFVSLLLVLFVVVHIVMVWRAGFRSRVSAMISGRVAPRKGHS
jgi:hypothetical protein